MSIVDRTGRPDRLEVKACVQCGWKRRVRVSFLYGDDKPTWSKWCTLCEAEIAYEQAARRFRQHKARVEMLRARRAKEAAEPRELPPDRDVVVHLYEPVAMTRRCAGPLLCPGGLRSDLGPAILSWLETGSTHYRCGKSGDNYANELEFVTCGRCHQLGEEDAAAEAEEP